MGTVTPGTLAQAGAYALACIDASVSGSEIFSVFAPDGSRLADLTVAVAYDNGHFGVTLADGATDFIVGDTFTITITDNNVLLPDVVWSVGGKDSGDLSEIFIK